MPGDTGARFRISTAELSGPTGLAADGEVEDYIATILDGSSPATTELSPYTRSNKLLFTETRTTFGTSQSTLFAADSDQLGTIEYVPLESNETLVVDLPSDQVLDASQIFFRALAANSQIGLVGDGATLDLTNELTEQALGRINIDLSPTTPSSVLIDAALAAKWSAGDVPMRVTLREGDRVIVRNHETWRLTEPVVSGFGFQLRASTISGPAATIEVDTSSPWQNFLDPSDINNDGEVSARDALSIINELDRRAFSNDTSEVLTNPAQVDVFPGTYYDQNGDGRASAVDALRVINRLSTDASTEPLGEAPPDSNVLFASPVRKELPLSLRNRPPQLEPVPPRTAPTTQSVSDGPAPNQVDSVLAESSDDGVGIHTKEHHSAVDAMFSDFASICPEIERLS